MLPPQANFIRKATVCLHSFISICADSETVGMVIDMNREELTKLPGRPEEQAWLRERLEVLTVREGIALDAAIQRHPVQDSAEAVSLLANLVVSG